MSENNGIQPSISVKKLVLDVLKPHQPSALAFASELAKVLNKTSIGIKVIGVDDKTQDIVITLTGDNVDYALAEEAITNLGASVHSIDEVIVTNDDA